MLLRPATLLTCALALALALLARAASALELPAPEWTPAFEGVALARLELAAPRPLVLHAVRIALATPGLSWLATPAAPGASAAAETRGLRTSSFLREHRLQLAINGAPFGPVREDEGEWHDVAGLQVSQGRQVSGPQGKYPALLLRDGARAEIAAPPFSALDGVHTAVGGFDIVLRGGQVLWAGDAADPGTRPSARHPRTAAGVSADGRTLWLLVVDGRQAGYSEGMSLHEIGQALRALGAHDGINLDGGGTSTLVVEGAQGEPLVLNRPIHGGVPGRERVSASHLGLWAQGLKR